MTNCWHGCGGIAVDSMKLRDEMIKQKQGLADALFVDGGEKLVTEMTDAELMDFVRLADARDDEFA